MPGALHRLGPGIPHRPLGHAGHWLHLGAPAEVARMLDEFLAKRDAAALAPDAFSKATVAIQGFPALEALLYGDGGPATTLP